MKNYRKGLLLLASTSLLLAACTSAENNGQTAEETENTTEEAVVNTEITDTETDAQETDLSEASARPVDFNPEELNYDINFNQEYLDRAAEAEEELLSEWNEGSYSFENPMTVLNPYGVSPLTAIAVFETEEPVQVSVTINGKDEHATLTHEFEGIGTFHEIPILGLYPDAENQVTLTAVTESGEEEETELVIQTEPLPENFYTIDVFEADPEQMQDGLTFLVSSSGEFTGVDHNGDVRFYISTWSAQNFEHLDNGNFMLALRQSEETGGTRTYPYDNVVEFNALGKPFTANIFEIDNYSESYPLHHDFIELQNGNMLALVHDGGGTYVEDEMVEFDKDTGDIVNNFSYRDLFPEVFYEEFPGEHHDEGGEGVDWFHQNTISQVEDGGLLASARNQSMIIKTSYPEFEIEWILTEDDNWPNDERPGDYLLEPINDVKFQTGQHAVREMPDQDGNPDTMDIILFDNNRYEQRGDLEIETDYSRAVQYRINEEDMTVEEIWSYGEELGPDFYTPIVSSAYYYEDTDNVLIDFGYINDGSRTEKHGGAPYSYITEVTRDEEAEVVFAMDVGNIYNDVSDRAQIYRAERIPFDFENAGTGITFD